jgi:hypothetical protein
MVRLHRNLILLGAALSLTGPAFAEQLKLQLKMPSGKAPEHLKNGPDAAKARPATPQEEERPRKVLFESFGDTIRSSDSDRVVAREKALENPLLAARSKKAVVPGATFGAPPRELPFGGGVPKGFETKPHAAKPR